VQALEQHVGVGLIASLNLSVFVEA
jgi:hypothetical protein